MKGWSNARVFALDHTEEHLCATATVTLMNVHSRGDGPRAAPSRSSDALHERA